MKVDTRPLPPTSQEGLEARLDGLADELDAIGSVLAGSRAGRYLVDAQTAIWKAITLARQGL